MLRYNYFYVLLLWLSFISVGFADATQDRRLTISATIFPRLVAVDEDLDKKTDAEGNIRLGLLYFSDLSKAEEVSQLIERKISNIAGKKIVFELINVSNTELSQLNHLSGLFLVQPLSDALMQKVNMFVIENHILGFSPFEGDVERGAMASIFVGAKIRPYFNSTTIKNSQIKLKPELLNVSKIYE